MVALHFVEMLGISKNEHIFGWYLVRNLLAYYFCSSDFNFSVEIHFYKI